MRSGTIGLMALLAVGCVAQPPVAPKVEAPAPPQAYQVQQEQEEEEAVAERTRSLPSLSADVRWRSEGRRFVPYRSSGVPYNVYRRGRLYRVYFIYAAPYYIPYYVPYYLPYDIPSIPRTVTIDNHQYYPSTLTVAQGVQVTWINRDDEAHTVTAVGLGIDYFDSGNIPPGGSYSHTFNAPGTFSYYCRIHPYMRGSVTVRATNVQYGGGYQGSYGGYGGY